MKVILIRLQLVIVLIVLKLLDQLRKTIECVERGEIPSAIDKHRLKSIKTIKEEDEPLNNNLESSDERDEDDDDDGQDSIIGDHHDLSTIDDVTESIDEPQPESSSPKKVAPPTNVYEMR